MWIIAKVQPLGVPTALYKYVICHMIKQTFIQVFVYKYQSLSQCFTTLWAWNINCVSSVRIRSYSCPDFSACRLNSVRMMENADQNNSEYGHFLRNDLCWFWCFDVENIRNTLVFCRFEKRNLRIQSEYGKVQTRKNSVFEHFSCSDWYMQRQ